MSFVSFVAYLRIYFRTIFSGVSLIECAVMTIVSMALTAFFVIRNKCPVYGAIALGVTTFIGMFLLKTAVLNRVCIGTAYSTRFDFRAERYRLFYGNEVQRVQILLNLVAFVPFGFFLSEFLFVTKVPSVGWRFKIVTLVAFGFSLSIECIQLFFRLGLFELTDLVMNSFGGVIGASLAIVVKLLCKREKKMKSYTLNI